MTINQFIQLIAGTYDVSEFKTLTSYVVKLGKAGCVTLQYVDDKFKGAIVDGAKKVELQNLINDFLLQLKKLNEKKLKNK